MAVFMKSPSRTTSRNTWLKQVAKVSLAAPLRRTCQIPQIGNKKMRQPECTKAKAKRIPLKLFASPIDDSNVNIYSATPDDTIALFYSAINEKNLKQLDTILSDDCFFEDYTYLKPFRGKKEALHFLKQLITCMGQNMKFYVENTYQWNESTVGTKWHLEWKKIQVPFTRGCSYYSLSREGNRLVIKKAQILIESPIKPGGVTLALFKTVTTLFDAFPDTAERFLKSPQAVFQLLLKLYSITIKPIISPLLAWYIKLMNFTALILGFILNLLYYIVKIFYN